MLKFIKIAFKLEKFLFISVLELLFEVNQIPLTTLYIFTGSRVKSLLVCLAFLYSIFMLLTFCPCAETVQESTCFLCAAIRLVEPGFI